MIHLYVKTHNKTGKKYFGQTSKDPMKYRGSGIAWRMHLAEFGNDVSTELIGSFADREECKCFARNFSIQNNIVESDDWLNLIPETLGGGCVNGIKTRDSLYAKYGSEYYKQIAQQKSPEVREAARQKLLNNVNCSIGGKQNKGRVREKIACPNCQKVGARNVMLRWHFDNCKSLDASIVI